MLELGIIFPVVTDHASKKCLVITHDGKYGIILSGSYEEEETISTSSTDKNNLLLHFGQEVLMFNEIILSNENKDIYHKIRILTEQLEFTEISKKKCGPNINSLLKKCLYKKNVGFKATIDTFNKATFDFVIDQTQFSLEGPISDKKVMLDTRGEFCFQIGLEMPFLRYLLDSIYIDLSSVIPYEESIDQIKIMVNILISNYKYKLLSGYNRDKILNKLKR